MAGTRTLTIEILGDASKGLKAFQQTETGASKFSTSIGKVVTAAGGILAAGAAFTFLKGAIGDAAAEGQEMEVLAATMRNTVGATDAQIASTEKWITSMQNATGIADGALRPALGKLLIAGRSVEQAQKDMATAADIAAARNVDLETVVNAMSKAAQGNTGALGRLGIATKGAAGETLTYDQILKNASKTMGGTAAAAADTAAGRAAILTAKFADLKENIGGALIPVMETLTGVLTKVTDWFNQLSPGMQKAVLVGGALIVAIGPMVALITNVISVVKGLSVAMAFLAANPIVLVIAAITALGVGLVLAYQKSETFRNIVNGVFEAVKSAVGALRGVWDAAWAAISGAVQRAWDLIRPIVGLVVNAVNTISNAVSRITGSNLGGQLEQIRRAAQPRPVPRGGRALGGSVTSSMPYLVGEAGPEMFIPDTGGMVVSNSSLRGGGGGGGSTIVINMPKPRPGDVYSAEGVYEALREAERRHGPLKLRIA